MEANRRFSMRITDEDSDLLAKRAEEAGLTRTDYMRLLLRAPVEIAGATEGPDPDAYVLDRMTAAHMAYQMRKLGHHYNQAVHALNRLAFYEERGTASRDDAESSFERVSRELEEVDSKVEELNAKLHRMVGSSFGVVMFEPKAKGHWS